MGTPDQPIAGAIPIEPGRISPALKAAQSEQGGQATAEMLRKTIKSALNSLGRGLVSTAYAELLQAVSPESPMPDEKLEEDLEQVAGLVAEARRLMKGFDGKQVLQKLDAADKLHREIASKLVKDASTSSAGFASQRLRLRAHAKLSEYEEVDRLSEPLWEAGVLDSPEVFARMEAAWFLARFDAAADAARYYSRHPDWRDPHSTYKKTRSEQILATIETRCKGTDAYKQQKWDRAITFFTSALRAAERVGCGEKTLAALNYNLGMAHLKAKHFSSAGEYFDWALRFDNDHIKALRNRAIVSEHFGHFDDALADLSDALELSEEHESAMFCAAIECDIERIQNRLDKEDDFLRDGAQFFDDYVYRHTSSKVQDQHFRTLGISPGSSETEVKTAFRSLARLHHPDKGGDAESPRFATHTAF
ncbi:hypothetical protein BMF94_5875 [Rhodotorula taiwanensis]|uniref:J domain-containing protein n=1 Tax=Rhodotorula taiwanensis TaxID=741276 RepID=A0A2S5B2V4_9BASI|nr:hypothetical protein BMF94_5875 [Rhodotorula taiwanensis]